MCEAPDYNLVHESKKAELIDNLKACIRNFFSDNPKDCSDYGRLVNHRQFLRVKSYLQQGQIECGGTFDETENYIAPTILTNVDLNAPIMQEEIFGPILPIISFSNQQEALNIIATNENPLAFYLFTSSKDKENDWLNKVAFGGGCLNNCAWQLTNHHLPFGGRGFSGTGSYHGKFGFETFSHKKSWMKTPTWFDPAIKYPPFKGKLGLLKKLFK
jgi:aldehyde dehydrogenase (NAD+)